MSHSPDDRLVDARAEVQAVLARSDIKASFLIAFDTAILTGVTAVAASVSVPAVGAVLAGVAAVLLAAAAGVLLRVVRPRLTMAAGSVPHWAAMTPSRLVSHVGDGPRAEAVVALARIAVAKHRHLRWAVDLTMGAGVLLAVAAAVTIGVAL